MVEHASYSQASLGGDSDTKLVIKCHKVRKGENFSTIAKKYGVSVTELKKANKISGTKITVGEKINIPKKHPSQNIHKIYRFLKKNLYIIFMHSQKKHQII
ncbi:MAG: LysM peptidoglycan-binding domain-containing protein [Rikenellaceae bacterium]